MGETDHERPHRPDRPARGDDMTARIPNPGSVAAIHKGCDCPWVENWYGEYDKSSTFEGWWTFGTCRLHNSDAFIAQENAEDYAAMLQRKPAIDARERF